MPPETLAHKLGTTTHLSPLLMKARRLGLRTPEDLCALAVKRGCRYYDMHGDSSRVQEEMPRHGAAAPAPESSLSNEELAMALLSICHPYSQHCIRVGAAMLSATGNSTQRLSSLTVQERCEVVTRHVAQLGHQVEPENSFWQDLLDAIPPVPPAPIDVLPHVTRFAAMNGLSRGGKEITMQWIRPSAA